ncbi:MAG TPA: amidohydrolase family protein [Acidimicrobiales bacterium]|nr:amidohydrolase family protein [Acidimicrobiales bacterium]
MEEVPRIISVDDHVIEPADLWSSRLPAKYADRAPRIVRQKLKIGNSTGGAGTWVEAEDGDWGDVWHYEDVRAPMIQLFAAPGFGELAHKVTTYEQYQPGTWKQKERLEAMTDNHVDAAVCFPNSLPRFAGQTFSEREDKELAFLCIQAYNDWMIDDWCAGDGRGRLIPLTIVPLWDAELAAQEVRRCADKGSFAIAFVENPYPLGFPSIHDKGRFWDPFFAACQETESTVCMHIGSSSKMPSTSPDAPAIISSTLTFQNAMGSLLDFIFSGTLERFPTLTLAYSEGQVGWMPYILERADKLWEERSDNSFGTWLTVPPSSFIPDRVYGCIFDDAVGLRERNAIGMGQICFETDYPHADSTWPHSKEVLAKLCAEAGLDDSEIYQLARGNAIRAFGLERFGITR